MPAAHFKAERIGKLLEREAAVDDRADAAAIERAYEILLVVPAADDQALQPRLLRHQGGRRHLTGAAGKHADQRNMSADAHRLDRLRQRARAADLDNMIDTAAAGPLAHHPAQPSCSR